MNPRFKPVISPSVENRPAGQPFNLKIVPAESLETPFQPLSSVLLPAGSGPMTRRDAADPDNVVDPRLETRRQGDRITRISVTCSCGRLHEIECEY